MKILNLRFRNNTAIVVTASNYFKNTVENLNQMIPDVFSSECESETQKSDEVEMRCEEEEEQLEEEVEFYKSDHDIPSRFLPLPEEEKQQDEEYIEVKSQSDSCLEGNAEYEELRKPTVDDSVKSLKSEEQSSGIISYQPTSNHSLILHNSRCCCQRTGR